MAETLRQGGELDPVVLYHRPEGHPLREEQNARQRDYEVDDGFHRLSAYRAVGADTVRAIVFHERGCC